MLGVSITFVIYLAVLICIPVVLIVVALICFSTLSSSGGTSVTSLPVDKYLQELNNPHINEWINQSGNELYKAYVLRHESADGEQMRVRYLVYLPCLTEMPQISIRPHSGLFGRILELEMADVDYPLGLTDASKNAKKTFTYDSSINVQSENTIAVD